jgi:hypothetical protein
MVPHPTDHDWRHIAEKATKEKGPARLMVLIAKLCQALDRENGKKPEFQRQQENQTGFSPDVA